MAGTELLKVTIRGTMPGGEVWSINPVYSTPTEPDLTYDQLNTIVTAINARTVPSALLAALSTDCAVVGARVEQRTRDGVLEGMAEGAKTTPVAGTGSDRMPLQTSVVVSLISVLAGGRGRGRLYWPLTSAGLSSGTHRIGSSTVDSLIAGFETYLSGIQTDIATTATQADLVVWSRAGTAYHGVTKLRVGNVPDTQRRRRDALIETYKTVDYVP